MLIANQPTLISKTQMSRNSSDIV